MLLSAKRASHRIALTAVFAAIYFVLGTIPVFPLATGGFLRANKLIAPLAGMLLGPVLGGASMVLGSFLFVAFSGQPPLLPLGPLPLDFVPDTTVALVSGIAFSSRMKAALLVPILVILAYIVDPISVVFVRVGGFDIPFMWFHVGSVVVFAAAVYLKIRGRIGGSGMVFVGATAFVSLLTGQLAGTILGQNISVRYGTLSLAAWVGRVSNWPSASAPFIGFFYTYPIERSIYTVASVLIAFPVLRALRRRTKTVTASR